MAKDNLVSIQIPAEDQDAIRDAFCHAAGVYLYRITTGQFTDVKKCILLK